MTRFKAIAALLLFIAIGVAVSMGTAAGEAAVQAKKLIYDEAGLLSQAESDRLNEMASEYGAKRETDFIVYTTSNTGNADVKKMTEDFYDEHGPGYDKAYGNAVILTLDMRNRELYLAGFYKGEDYLDDERLDKIRDKISPYLTDGEYELAFQTYIEKAYKYMGYRPGVNPDNILFNIWFQLAVSFIIGAVVVGIMAYNSGGRVTVSSHTYEDASTSGVLDHRDLYLRTTTTKRKIERNNRSGGGGGGVTGGGHSHSGSRGSF